MLTWQSWVLSAFCGIICPIIIGSGMYRFRKNATRYGMRHVQARKPNIVWNSGVWTLIHIIIERPYAAYYDNNWIPNNMTTKLIYLLLPGLPMICFYGLLRIWLLHYETFMNDDEMAHLFARRFSRDQSRDKKRNRISIHRFAVDDELPQFFRAKFRTILLAIPCLLYLVIHLGVTTHYGDNLQSSTVLSAIMLSIPFVFICYLLWTLPYDSNFKRKLEFELMLGNVLFGMLMTLLVHFTAGPDWSYFLHSVTITTCITISFVIQTHLILCLVKHKPIGDNGKEKKQNTDQDQRMKETLQKRVGFAKFQDFLRREQATENIKFFVEVCKFRKVVSRWLADTHAQTEIEKCYSQFDDMEFNWVFLPDNFRVFFVKMYAKHLYDEYIAQESPFEMNIPNTMRNACMTDITSGKAKRLLEAFDRVHEEAWLLMSDTYRRFEASPTGQALSRSRRSMFGTGSSIWKKPQIVRVEVSQATRVKD